MRVGHERKPAGNRPDCAVVDIGRLQRSEVVNADLLEIVIVTEYEIGSTGGIVGTVIRIYGTRSEESQIGSCRQVIADVMLDRNLRRNTTPKDNMHQAHRSNIPCKVHSPCYQEIS